jgi:hypothetical protein
MFNSLFYKVGTVATSTIIKLSVEMIPQHHGGHGATCQDIESWVQYHSNIEVHMSSNKKNPGI